MCDKEIKQILTNQVLIMKALIKLLLPVAAKFDKFSERNIINGLADELNYTAKMIGNDYTERAWNHDD